MGAVPRQTRVQSLGRTPVRRDGPLQHDAHGLRSIQDAGSALLLGLGNPLLSFAVGPCVAGKEGLAPRRTRQPHRDGGTPQRRAERSGDLPLVVGALEVPPTSRQGKATFAPAPPLLAGWGMAAPKPCTKTTGYNPVGH